MSELPLNILSQQILITCIEPLYLSIYILIDEYKKRTVAPSFKLQVALKNYKPIYRRKLCPSKRTADFHHTTACHYQTFLMA
jgi:hypothetical protein